MQLFRVLTRLYSPLPGGQFHEDWTICVTFRVKRNHRRRVMLPKVKLPIDPDKNCAQTDRRTHRQTKRRLYAPPQNKFWGSIKNSPPPGGHVCQPTRTSFDLVQDIIGTNLSFMKTRQSIRPLVLTRKKAPPLWKNARPPGGHVFQPPETNFELIQDFIGTNVLTRTKLKLYMSLMQGNITRGRQTDGQCDHYMPSFRGIKKKMSKANCAKNQQTRTKLELDL
ncbi:hypothetical protein DPMN_155833 [Dreissena polymorpha]|uniref:Uncharacterized protein n=1 Tax=Dreissena polymorpha TaxID=45954 RepID=A0A9D4JBR2_DREPO|nr:hypothetical protein DPMN_155833 [Dreissena polymorpha]